MEHRFSQSPSDYATWLQAIIDDTHHVIERIKDSQETKETIEAAIAMAAAVEQHANEVRVAIFQRVSEC